MEAMNLDKLYKIFFESVPRCIFEIVYVPALLEHNDDML